MTKRGLIQLMAAVVLSGATLIAQAPAQQPPPAAPAQAPAVKADQTPPADTYTYRVEGRRDPFLSLLHRGVEARPAGQPAEGLANLTVGEIVLKGILRSRGAYLAMVQGPNQKTYIVRPKERLVDGVIKEITADSLVIVQDVNDPLSVTKQKEIRKTLREL
ncbi:MAG: hypothetical protein HY654_06330 [Acidobacteria bacterium]|nr:hypothetical protein [Acidobacteriota bacterium]